jgi:hypothetical protein
MIADCCEKDDRGGGDGGVVVVAFAGYGGFCLRGRLKFPFKENKLCIRKQCSF